MRKTRRTWWVAGAFLVVMGVVVVVWRHHRREGFIDSMAAVSADAAVFVWRSNDGKMPTSWVGRVDGHGHAVWVQPLPNVVTAIGGRGPITIVDGVVVVRYGDYTTAGSAIAFDLADGRPLWDHVLVPYAPNKEETLMYVSDVPAGKALISFAHDGKQLIATRTIARTGTVSWSHPSAFDEQHYSPIAFGDDFAAHGIHDAWLTNGAAGTARALETAGTGCALENEYLVVERTDDAGSRRLVAHASADAKPRVIAEPFDVFEGDPFVYACGRHGDDLAFLVQVHTTDAVVSDAIITDRNGKLLHRIELGKGWVLPESLTMKDPQHATFGGELPRFTLFFDSAATTLVMVDLETAAIAWRSKPDRALIQGELFHTGTRWIWFDHASSTISAFDGTTGKLTAAVNAYSYRGILGISQMVTAIATNDSLWIYSEDVTTPDSANIAVLDLATLAPRFVREIKLTDETAAVREKLGL